MMDLGVMMGFQREFQRVVMHIGVMMAFQKEFKGL
jgi:hypothetical protein